MSKSTKLKAALRVAEVACAEFQEFSGSIVVDKDEAARHRESFPRDNTALEAFTNHLHLEDLVEMASPLKDVDHSLLMKLGRLLIQIWAERLSTRFPKLEFLFYLGGCDSVSLRVHVARRDAAPWVSLDDYAFIESERLEIYRLSAGVVALHGK
jgi:hypothetical protein